MKLELETMILELTIMIHGSWFAFNVLNLWCWTWKFKLKYMMVWSWFMKLWLQLTCLKFMPMVFLLLKWLNHMILWYSMLLGFINMHTYIFFYNSYIFLYEQTQNPFQNFVVPANRFFAPVFWIELEPVTKNWRGA